MLSKKDQRDILEVEAVEEVALQPPKRHKGLEERYDKAAAEYWHSWDDMQRLTGGFTKQSMRSINARDKAIIQMTLLDKELFLLGEQ